MVLDGSYEAPERALIRTIFVDPPVLELDGSIGRSMDDFPKLVEDRGFRVVERRDGVFAFLRDGD